MPNKVLSVVFGLFFSMQAQPHASVRIRRNRAGRKPANGQNETCQLKCMTSHESMVGSMCSNNNIVDKLVVNVMPVTSFKDVQLYKIYVCNLCVYCD